MDYGETVEVEEGENAGVYVLGGLLAYNISLYDDTLYKIMELYRPMMKDYRGHIIPLFDSYDAGDITLLGLTNKSGRAMELLSRKWQTIFENSGKRIAVKYVKDQSKYSAKSVRSASKDLMPPKKSEFKEESQNLTALEGAAYLSLLAMILSGQRFYAEKIGFMVSASVKSGAHMGLNEYFDKQEGITGRWVKNKLGDNLRQDYNAFNREFMRINKLDMFAWVHTDRAKEPRPFHKYKLNGSVYDVNNPPVIDDKTGQRGFPGDLWGCRCIMRIIKKI